MNGLIYISTSRTSGKSYIGQTRQTLRDRVRRHIRNDAPHCALFHAIKKYGLDDFSWTTVDNIPEELLSEWEKFFIRELHTLAPSGYNLTEGGESGPRAKEVIERARERMKGKKPSDACLMAAKLHHPWKGRVFTEEHRRNISQSKMGHPVSEEQRRVSSLRMKGNKFAQKLKGLTWRVVDGKRVWFKRVV